MEIAMGISIADVLQILPEQIIIDESNADSEAEILILPTKSMSGTDILFQLP